MFNTTGLMSSNKQDWSTPKDFYDKLNKEFCFTFDPCPLNPSFDGLKVDWVGNIFINPPYNNQRSFFEKGLEELKKGNAKLLVYLVPSRTDTKLFHELIYGKAEIRFIKGRLKFGGSNGSAPLPSMLVIFRKNN
jgi:site-specific DNA-methyltransferase (adenine-specific)